MSGDFTPSYDGQILPTEEEERRKSMVGEEIQKKKICDFINIIDPIKLKQLKLIKLHYSGYSNFDDDEITLLRNKIADIHDELNTTFNFIPITFSLSTKKKLNQQLTSLNAKLEEVIYCKSFVDKIHQEFKLSHDKYLSVGNFFRMLDDLDKCRPINATAEVINTNATAVVIPTDKTNKIDSESTLEATKLAQKYFKYKQKYLNLKNKVN